MFLIIKRKYILAAALVAFVAAFFTLVSTNDKAVDYVISVGADADVSEANLTPKLIKNSKDSPEKTAYLTFDDGPTKNTELILDALAAYDAKATFFVLGEEAEQNPEILKRVFAEGHTIGNHSYSHVYKEVYGTREEFINELMKWEEVVGDIIGKEKIVKLLRFPGGSRDEWKHKYRDIAAEMGYKFVDWTALNGDADGKPFSKQRCMQEIKKYCTDTGDVVILMHDSARKDITAKMLPEILEFLKSQGYNFKRIEV
ncbi:MAG: polysaccharide deacetylase family protein [Monoglobales bacterium]